MLLSESKHIISRKDFLKILGTAGIMLGTGGLASIIGSSNQKSFIQEPRIEDSIPLSTQRSTIESPFDYVIYSTGPITNLTYWSQRISDGKQLIKDGSRKSEVVIQAALDQ